TTWFPGYEKTRPTRLLELPPPGDQVGSVGNSSWASPITFGGWRDRQRRRSCHQAIAQLEESCPSRIGTSRGVPTSQHPLPPGSGSRERPCRPRPAARPASSCLHKARSRTVCTRALWPDAADAVLVGRNMDYLRDLGTNLWAFP